MEGDSVETENQDMIDRCVLYLMKIHFKHKITQSNSFDDFHHIENITFYDYT